jgi:hypothetical protein
MIPRQFAFATIILCTLTLGMSFYVWELRHRETITPRPQPEAAHVSPPTAGPTENVTAYVAYDAAGELRAQTISIPLTSGRQERGEQLVRGLLKIYLQKNSPHPMSAGAEIHDLYLVDPGVAVIDVNSAFADGQISGVLPEELTVLSLVQTLSSNIPGITKVKILADGKERETLAGHADLTEFYDVSQVSEAAKQLSAQ